MSTRARRILVVDDDAPFREMLAHLLLKRGFEAVEAGTGEEALAAARQEVPDVVLLDLVMPGLGGAEVLRQLKHLNSGLPVIIISGKGLAQDAVAALRSGANDYLVKPITHADLIRSIDNAMAVRAAAQTSELLTGQHDDDWLRDRMGTSDAIAKVCGEAVRVAPSGFSVLILGETGTGKELVAEAVHRASRRPGGPFVAVDCGAIPETLFESELFGHEKGAFTGSDRCKPGRFELAKGGTLFLDEVSNMPLGCQAKLLRVLQERRLFRVGGTAPLTVDVRLVAASNEDLEAAVRSEAFRRDLFYRLNEFVIRIPPLRERSDDIVFLARRFLQQADRELGKAVTGFTDVAEARLLEYDWPGNVRQLRSAIRRAVLLADRAIIDEQDLPIPNAGGGAALRSPTAPLTASSDAPSLRQLVHRVTETVERTALTDALRTAGGNKARAARLLQIDYKTMFVKLKEYGLFRKGGTHAVEEGKER